MNGLKFFALPVGFLFSNLVFAAVAPSHSEWFCREDAATRSGQIVKVCGVATAASLDQARRMALIQAKQEFLSLCKESDDCRGFAFNVTPLRTDCEPKGENHICYRGLEYTILEKRDSKQLYDEEIAQLKEREDALKEEMERVRELQQRRSRVNALEARIASGNLSTSVNPSDFAGDEETNLWRLRFGASVISSGATYANNSIPPRLAPGIYLGYRIHRETRLELGVDAGIVGTNVGRVSVGIPALLPLGGVTLGPELCYESGSFSAQVTEPNPFWNGTDWEGRPHTVYKDIGYSAVTAGFGAHLRPFRKSGFLANLGVLFPLSTSSTVGSGLTLYAGMTGEFDF
jgi:hypothetical protein